MPFAKQVVALRKLMEWWNDIQHYAAAATRAYDEKKRTTHFANRGAFRPPPSRRVIVADGV